VITKLFTIHRIKQTFIGPRLVSRTGDVGWTKR